MGWIILSIILILLFCALSTLLVIFLAKRRKLDRGKSGEKSVEAYLISLCRKKEYVVSDILLSREEHKSSQIDHVLLSRKGIFCIETKNNAGRIFGYEDDRRWRQILAGGKVTNTLFNPVLQNRTHIYVLNDKVEKHPYHNVVIFPSADEIDVDSKKVYTLKSFQEYYDSLKENSVKQATIDRIYKKLLNFKKHPTITKKEHVENIERIHDVVSHNICPRCGKKLVLVQNDEEIYFRCEGYPKCTFRK